jgi:hypothetical protein
MNKTLFKLVNEVENELYKWARSMSSEIRDLSIHNGGLLVQ